MVRVLRPVSTVAAPHNISRRALVVGGFNGKEILHDAFILDTKTWCWSEVRYLLASASIAPSLTPYSNPQLLLVGNPTPPLVGHAMAQDATGNRLYIYGGSINERKLLPHVYVLDTEPLMNSDTPPARTQVVRVPMEKDTIPAARFWHRMVILRRRLVCFGGMGSRASPFNDLMTLNISLLPERLAPSGMCSFPANELFSLGHSVLCSG